MKTLIGSVFSGTGKPQLLDLQLSFISQNTINEYDHVCYLTEKAKPTEYNKHINSSIIGQNNLTHKDPSKSHLNGLLSILAYFKTQTDYYDMFIILDSDCFPINKSWDQTCYGLLQKNDIISCIRTENLDTFLHPSICAFKDVSLIDFQRLEIDNLLGEQTSDNQVVPLWKNCNQSAFLWHSAPSDWFGSTDPQSRGEFRSKAKVFPLIRTNRKNHHPILAAIYGDLFYHHGCGSRSQVIRSNPYYDQLSINYSEDTSACLLQMLLESPCDYISNLMS
jgi:hypothetical protein